MDLLPVGVDEFGFSTVACNGDIAIGINMIPAGGDASVAIDCIGAPPNASGLVISASRRIQLGRWSRASQCSST